jgi:antitoxin PrlF
MNPALTVKSQVTIPKEIREFLGVGPGERISFEPLPDGRVAIAPVHRTKRKRIDPFEAMRGTSKSKLTTDETMRATRGDDWNRG